MDRSCDILSPILNSICIMRCNNSARRDLRRLHCECNIYRSFLFLTRTFEGVGFLSLQTERALITVGLLRYYATHPGKLHLHNGRERKNCIALILRAFAVESHQL